jgi:hypothetical protein
MLCLTVFKTPNCRNNFIISSPVSLPFEIKDNNSCLIIENASSKALDFYRKTCGFTVERKNKVAENRQLLFNAMTCEGSKFKAISNEWWHYQLNDKRHKNPLM